MPVEMLVTRQAQKDLEAMQQGPARIARDHLIQRFHTPDGFVESKGTTGFSGIDQNCGGYRSIFALNAKDQPVLVRVMPHADYDDFSNAVRAKKIKPSDLAEDIAGAQRMTYHSPRIDKTVSINDFNASYVNADELRIRNIKPALIEDTAITKPSVDDFAIQFMLATNCEKFALSAPEGARYIYEPDTETLLTIEKDGKKSLGYGPEKASLAFEQAQSRLNVEALVVTAEEARLLAAAKVTPSREKDRSAAVHGNAPRI